jgi:hypothetical protein
MKTLKSIGLSLTLITLLSTAVFAGETPSPPYVCGETATPPCACAPGETSGPPCASQSVYDVSAVPGETHTPPALSEVAVTDLAETLLWSLLLF